MDGFDPNGDIPEHCRWHSTEADASGSLHTTAREYARLLEAFLEPGLRVRHPDVYQRQIAIDARFGWSLGWGTADDDILWQWGDHTAFTAFAALVPSAWVGHRRSVKRYERPAHLPGMGQCLAGSRYVSVSYSRRLKPILQSLNVRFFVCEWYPRCSKDLLLASSLPLTAGLLQTAYLQPHSPFLMPSCGVELHSGSLLRVLLKCPW